MSIEMTVCHKAWAVFSARLRLTSKMSIKVFRKPEHIVKTWNSLQRADLWLSGVITDNKTTSWSASTVNSKHGHFQSLSPCLLVCVLLRILNMTWREVDWSLKKYLPGLAELLLIPADGTLTVLLCVSVLHEFINKASGKHITIQAWQPGQLHPHLTDPAGCKLRCCFMSSMYHAAYGPLVASCDACHCSSIAHVQWDTFVISKY